MKKLYGDKVRQKSGIEQAISEIVNEVVDANPRLKKIKHKADMVTDNIKSKASVLEERAKLESKKLLENVSTKARTLKEKAQNELKLRRASSANSFAFVSETH